MTDDLYKDLCEFDAQLSRASERMEQGGPAYPPQVAATLTAGILVAKAIVLLARTNRRVRRA